MSHPPSRKTATSWLLAFGAVAVSLGLAFSPPGYAQMTAEEHAKHHPEQAKEQKADGTGGMAGGDKKDGGMAGGGMDMGKMMENMGKPPPKELYPTLMSLPDLLPEQREEVRSKAQERMRSGVALLSKGLEKLAEATEKGTSKVMQEATAEVREALAQFESGLAAQRALDDGKPPRQVALQWFKGEMNLQTPQGVEVRGGLFGLSLFHLVVMTMLTAFAAVMIWMYFHKMQRATLLLQSLTGGAPPADVKVAPPPPADPKASPPATPPAEDAKAAPPPADANAARPPATDANAAPPAATPSTNDKTSTRAADAKAAPPPATDANAAPPAAMPSANGKAAPLAADASSARNGSGTSAPISLAPKKWSGKLRIGQIFEETHNVKTFRLIDPLGGELPFTFLPGQYMTVTVLPEGKPVKRSYTIASSPSEHAYVGLTIKREDEGVESRYLHDRVQVGDLLDFAGPSGSFVFTGRECRCLVFIAAGVGITPLMSVTRYLTDRSWPGEIYLLYSCHSPKDFIFKEELEFLQRRHPNLRVLVTVSNAGSTHWKGPKGRITKALIAKFVPDIATRRVHICGPKEMMEATEGFLAELGVLKEQVKTEAFGPAIGKPEGEAKPTDSKAATPVAPAPKPPAVEASPVTSAAATPEDPTEVVKAAQGKSEAPTAAPPSSNGAVALAATVTFSRSAKTAPLTPEKSVLEASEDIGVNIPFECRVGTCGVCKTKLVSGKVTMAVEDALTPEDKAAGIILACQAKSAGNVSVEA